MSLAEHVPVAAKSIDMELMPSEVWDCTEGMQIMTHWIRTPLSKEADNLYAAIILTSYSRFVKSEDVAKKLLR